MANAHAKPHHDYHLANPSPWLFLFACIYVWGGGPHAG
jgi:hypothetical protein